MNRARTECHKGKKIVLVDLSHCAPEESIPVIPQAKKLIAEHPPKSALVLTDVTEATYNRQVADAIKDFVASNTPYVKASAVVGADGVRGVLL